MTRINANLLSEKALEIGKSMQGLLDGQDAITSAEFEAKLASITGKDAPGAEGIYDELLLRYEDSPGIVRAEEIERASKNVADNIRYDSDDNTVSSYGASKLRPAGQAVVQAYLNGSPQLRADFGWEYERSRLPLNDPNTAYRIFAALKQDESLGGESITTEEARGLVGTLSRFGMTISGQDNALEEFGVCATESATSESEAIEIIRQGLIANFVEIPNFQRVDRVAQAEAATRLAIVAGSFGLRSDETSDFERFGLQVKVLRSPENNITDDWSTAAITELLTAEGAPESCTEGVLRAIEKLGEASVARGYADTDLDPIINAGHALPVEADGMGPAMLAVVRTKSGELVGAVVHSTYTYEDSDGLTRFGTMGVDVEGDNVYAFTTTQA